MQSPVPRPLLGHRRLELAAFVCVRERVWCVFVWEDTCAALRHAAYLAGAWRLDARRQRASTRVSSLSLFLFLCHARPHLYHTHACLQKKKKVKTLPRPVPPPPTIIRFGDVGVAPAGCPMCPGMPMSSRGLVVVFFCSLVCPFLGLV